MRKLEKPILGFPQKFLRAWMMSAMKYFYRKVQVDMDKKPPLGEKPILFASNHQNAFMDALVVIATCGTVPSFLTRADIFQSKLTFKILQSLRMLPIYRQRDGKDSLQRNEEVFDMCVTLLQENDNMGIFPEGNHGKRPRLRPLKKGLARIALEAESRNNFELDVQIIPVGLHYSEHTKEHTDVMVSFGDPISAKDYQEAYEENPVRSLVAFTNDLRSGLEPLMIHISNQKYLNTIEALRKMFGNSLVETAGENPQDLKKRLHSDQELVAKLEAFINSDEEGAIQLENKLQTYEDGIYALNVSDTTLASAPYSIGSILLDGLVLLISLPLYIYGAINNVLIDVPAKKIMRLFKDDHFHASILMVSRMFLKPIVYTLQGGLFWAISGNFWLALAYVLSIEVSRRISHAWRRLWSKAKGKRTVFSLTIKKSAALENMKKLREELSKQIHELMEKKSSSQKEENVSA